jgi:23S rRNA (cytosine1962-C5)-methyltransferase
MNNLPIVILKPNEQDRVLAGHPWIFDNEISKIPSEFENGGIVMVKTWEGLAIGPAYINTKSRITVRMLDINKKPEAIYAKYIDIKALLEEKITAALKRRGKITNSDAMRLIYSEADSLPGLIVDLYKNTAVIQISTLGIDKLKDMIFEILDKNINPKIIYEKSLSPLRQKEGLEQVQGIIKPADGELKAVTITENGLKFKVDIAAGSKTGFYLDQRDNRQRLEKYVKGKHVLDAFCYTGAFSVYAAHFGAESVTGTDSSEQALEMAEKNVKLNKLKHCKFIKADVFDAIRAIDEKYGVIILDPPAFSKSKEQKEGGLRGYRDLHYYALKLLEKDGILFTFSCSHNVSMAELIQTAKEAAKRLRCRIEVKEQLFQAKDHPYNTNIPESFYLKGVVIGKK